MKGWIQIALTVVGMLVAGTLAYGNLKGELAKNAYAVSRTQIECETRTKSIVEDMKDHKNDHTRFETKVFDRLDVISGHISSLALSTAITANEVTNMKESSRR